MSPTQYVGRNCPGSKHRSRDAVKVTNLIDEKVKFDIKRKARRERMDKMTNAPTGGHFQVASAADEEVSPVRTEGEKVFCNNAPVDANNGKDHVIDSGRRQSNADVRTAIRNGDMAWGPRDWKDKRVVVDAKTNVVDGGSGATSDVSEGRLIAEQRYGMASDTEMLLFSRARTAQATGDYDSVIESINVANNISELVCEAIEKDSRPVPSEWHAKGSRSSDGMVLNSVVEGADTVDFWNQIQELLTD